MRRLIFFKTFILLFMGEDELSSLQWHDLTLIQQLFNFFTVFDCSALGDFRLQKPIEIAEVRGDVYVFVNDTWRR